MLTAIYLAVNPYCRLMSPVVGFGDFEWTLQRFGTLPLG